ncbi:divalent-cation tolerance protein CutA [Planctomycetota bacterium]|nr:divalent-cation tolerance protein CutA [Planctomycetota bacterium]
MPEPILVYVTCPDEQVAAMLGRIAVDERLAACANLLPGMRSIYRWQGRIDSAEETVLILKSTRIRWADLEARLRALHPYTAPCIVVLPIAAGSAPFLAWLATETGPADPPAE